MTAAQTAGALAKGRLTFHQQCVLSDLYRFVVSRENGKVFFGYSEETIRTILVHRASKRRLVFHRNEEREVDGILMWRRYRSPWGLADIRDWREDDEDGDEIYLEAAIADTPEARRWGILEFIRREPDCLHLRKTAARIKSGRRVAQEVPNKLISRLLK